MPVIRRSDGKEIRQRAKPLTEAQLQALRHAPTPRSVEMDKLVARREKAAREQMDGAHDRAVEAFDKEFIDLWADPSLAEQCLSSYNAIVRDAASQGRPIDLHSELFERGDQIRVSVGLPTTAERNRAEILGSMRSARKIDET